MSRRNPKPTPTNIRNRLFRIEADAQSAADLANLWQPKGRYYRARRELLELLPKMAEGARVLRGMLDRPTPRPLKPVKARDDNYVQRELGKLLGGMFDPK